MWWAVYIVSRSHAVLRIGLRTHRSHSEGSGSVSESCRTWAESGEFGDNDRGGLDLRFWLGGSSGGALRMSLVGSTRLCSHRGGRGGRGMIALPSCGAGNEECPGGNGETHGDGSLSEVVFVFKDVIRSAADSRCPNDWRKGEPKTLNRRGRLW